MQVLTNPPTPRKQKTSTHLTAPWIQAEVKKLSARMQQQAEMMAGQARGARIAAYENSQAVTVQLEEARAGAAREVEAAAARELSLLQAIESAETALEKEMRARRQLERSLDEANSKSAALTASIAEAAAGGDIMLRGDLITERRRAEEVELLAERLRSELKVATDEATRQRVRAENADAEAQRAEVRARRAVAQAESDRDAMALRLAQRGEAADAAMAEAVQLEARVRAESEAVTRFGVQETSRLRKQNALLQEQLSDAVEAAAQLQDILRTQQQLAEGYRCVLLGASVLCETSSGECDPYVYVCIMPLTSQA